MAHKTSTAKTAKPRRDTEAEVTARIVEALEANTVPWRKPWTASGILPTSVSTGRPYRGINSLLLAMTASERGYASPYWLTFNQAKERGGSIRKGEKGTLVVFWKSWNVKDDDDPEKTKRVFILRHFVVFNVEQTDDVELPPRFTPPAEVEPFSIDDAEAIFAGYVDGPELREAATDSAYYTPATDVITLPTQRQFANAEGYYGTLFHESVHSTGHASRLDRFAKNGEPQHFGGERYAREELVAEMGAAMLRSLAGIATDDSTEQSAAYVASWLEALRNDPKLVIAAAAQAQRATDRIVGTVFETEDADTETAVDAA